MDDNIIEISHEAWKLLMRRKSEGKGSMKKQVDELLGVKSNATA